MAASADRRLIAGRYALGAVLGRGGMGVVWRAEDVLLDRPVAVKEVELPAGLPDHERAGVRERALREARAAARLGHPSVVTLHDAVDATGRLFLVMELVDAPTCATWSPGTGRCPRRRRPVSAWTCSPRWRRRTARASSTTTSSRPT